MIHTDLMLKGASTEYFDLWICLKCEVLSWMACEGGSEPVRGMKGVNHGSA